MSSSVEQLRHAYLRDSDSEQMQQQLENEWKSAKHAYKTASKKEINENRQNATIRLQSLQRGRASRNIVSQMCERQLARQTDIMAPPLTSPPPLLRPLPTAADLPTLPKKRYRIGKPCRYTRSSSTDSSGNRTQSYPTLETVSSRRCLNTTTGENLVVTITDHVSQFLVASTMEGCREESTEESMEESIIDIRDDEQASNHLLPVRGVYRVPTLSPLNNETSQQNYVIFTPFVLGACDLMEWLRTSTHPPKRSAIISISLQILTGLQYLHKHGSGHGNLKPSTVLCRDRMGSDLSGGGIDIDGRLMRVGSAPSVYLARWGTNDNEWSTESIGTTAYRAPEMAVQEMNGEKPLITWPPMAAAAACSKRKTKGRKIKKKRRKMKNTLLGPRCVPEEVAAADVFSFGSILFLMCCGQEPFGVGTHNSIWSRATMDDVQWSLYEEGSSMNSTTNDCSDLVAMCRSIVCSDSNKRMKIQEIINEIDVLENIHRKGELGITTEQRQEQQQPSSSVMLSGSVSWRSSQEQEQRSKQQRSQQQRSQQQRLQRPQRPVRPNSARSRPTSSRRELRRSKRGGGGSSKRSSSSPGRRPASATCVLRSNILSRSSSLSSSGKQQQQRRRLGGGASADAVYSRRLWSLLRFKRSQQKSVLMKLEKIIGDRKERKKKEKKKKEKKN